MRRLVALGAALLLAASLASSTAAAPPPTADRLVGNFDILDWDGSLVGHVVMNYTVPDAQHWVPGSVDVTWQAGVRFPYDQPPSGARQSHALLTASWFGPRDGGGVETGVAGSLCDFGGPWNATCHDFGMVVLERTGETNLIAFARGQDWDTAEWYVIGPGTFALTYVAPTG